MNREILFRGKQVDGGEWAYGWYCKASFGAWPIRDCIIPSEKAEGGCAEHVEVDPATVGQYTGLTDRAGKRIFEGDVAEFDAYGLHYKGVVTVIGGNFCILCGEKASPFLDHALERYRATVTGNIHDHPELLEGNTQ